jgi:hypothetical protein
MAMLLNVTVEFPVLVTVTPSDPLVVFTVVVP